MIIKRKAIVIDGTTGGDISVLDEYRVVQIAISGRTTGLVTVTSRALGSDVFESFSPELELDLAIERTEVIEGFSLESLRFSISPAGADYTVKITQWPGN
jgi:hypothetical protein